MRTWVELPTPPDVKRLCRCCRMSEMRRRRNAQGDDTPYRHWTGQDGKHVIQAHTLRKEAARVEAHSQAGGLRR